jgi:hypothetical protein
MNLPALTYRLVKGSPITAAEHDQNLRTIRDFVNALSALFGVALNADGTLKAGSVNATTVLADRIITQAKMDWLFNFYGVASGVNTYAVTISPTTGYTPGLGVTSSLVIFVKFTNGCTGAATLNVNTAGAIPIKKNGGDALVTGDIAAGQIYCLAFDGTNFQILGRLSRPSQVGGLSSQDANGTATVLVTASAKIGEVSMTLPAGCTTWTWVRAVFATRLVNSVTMSSIQDWMTKAGTDVMAWVDTGRDKDETDNSDDNNFVQYQSEGDPAGHETDNPLVMSVWANDDGVKTAGDVVARRKMYVVGYAV